MRFLHRAIEEFLTFPGGTDIHVSPGNRLAYRVKGEIIQKGEPFSSEDTRDFAHELFSLLTEEESIIYGNKLKDQKHTGFSVSLKGERFRVNISKNGSGYHIVMRRLPSSPPDLQNLGFNEQTYRGLEFVLNRREGLFLVVGPTGSGKSTTLAAMVRRINETQRKHIITLEDPIEYLHPSASCIVVQKELGRDFPSFQEGLHSALREDPDVILVGEIRDPKSFELCMKASETGHLVLATLHTQDVVSTVHRLVALGGDNPLLVRDRLAQVLLGVIAQRLFLGRDGERHLCWEILITNKGVRNQIREGHLEQIKSLLDNTEYSQSFNRTIEELVRKGIMDVETAFALSPDPQNLRGIGADMGRSKVIAPNEKISFEEETI